MHITKPKNKIIIRHFYLNQVLFPTAIIFETHKRHNSNLPGLQASFKVPGKIISSSEATVII
ncbi:hypothetical protein DFO77_10646 [Marinilabilia salmonicolor]|uniref:Uncharacterized protein n=1 Tax=Marinilabilia salmonicolor TaxID=989 RepID=A0A368VCJ7_9BACT|nr:hypothetical protein DFO77_10646 [Marinilabilia salmonicolor]